MFFCLFAVYKSLTYNDHFPKNYLYHSFDIAVLCYSQLMIHPNPEMRPSAISLIQHRVLCPLGKKTKAQLRRELNAEKLKNEILSKQLHDAAMYLKSIAPNVVEGGKCDRQLRPIATRLSSSRIIGKKVNRSNSTTNF